MDTSTLQSFSQAVTQLFQQHLGLLQAEELRNDFHLNGINELKLSYPLNIDEQIILLLALVSHLQPYFLKNTLYVKD